MLDWLKPILGDNYTEDIEKKIAEEIGKGFVARNDFNTLNDDVKQLRGTVKERDTQLEGLKKATGDTEALQQQITDLQAANKTKDEQHAAAMQKQIAETHQKSVESALTLALTKAKARNPATIRPLLQMENAEFEENGTTVKGLDAQIRKLIESDDTKFLFDTEDPGPQKITGLKPAEAKGGADPDPFLAGFDGN